MKLYSELSSDFNPDGSLRDIYIFECNSELWNTLIENISRSTYKHEFWHGDSPFALPSNFNSIKKLQETNPTILKLFLPGNIQVNCHFFVESEVEMDVTPNEITGESKFNCLVSFLKWLSVVVNKAVVLTYENSPEQVILSVEPNVV